MKVIKVNLAKKSYPIFIEKDIFNNIPEKISTLKLGNYGIVITSASLAKIYKKRISTAFKRKKYRLIVVPDGEKAKSKKWLFSVINEILGSDSWGRKIFIVCLGGGVVGDLGGFIAAIYKRGIPYVQIPTTLLSQIDSSIGGKTAIDLKIAKNILGAFYQPKAVFIDPVFLHTLPKIEIRQGISESIKYGLIKDKNFFYFLRNNPKKIMDLDPASITKVITTCAKIKAKIVSDDALETKGLRTILNYGHTLAHAIESSREYKRIAHGDAVSIGMSYAARLSYSLGKCSEKCLIQTEEILKSYSLPINIGIHYLKLYSIMSYDKKFISGSIRMVILNSIGKVEVIEGISEKIVKETLKDFTKR